MFSSFATICSGVCFENFLMVIHSSRARAARTTRNNPLKTNGPKDPDPSGLLVVHLVDPTLRAACRPLNSNQERLVRGLRLSVKLLKGNG